MFAEFSGLTCLANSGLSFSFGSVMPHRFEAMLANCWFISSVKSASRVLRSSSSPSGSEVFEGSSVSFAFDASRNSDMLSSEGEMLYSSSSYLCLLVGRGEYYQTQSRSKWCCHCDRTSFEALGLCAYWLISLTERF